MRFLAFDTETTGLDKTKCNILTAYFVVLDKNLNIIDSLDLKIKHSVYTVYAKALEINNIDLVMHNKNEQSLYINDASKKLKDFLIKNKGKNRYIPLGHNINFDIDFLKSSNLLDNEFFSKYISFNVIDTITLGIFLKSCGLLQETQSLSLTSICKHLNINYKDYYENSSNLNDHTAEYDIKMTILLFKKFKEIYNIKNVNSNSDNEINTINKKRKL